MAKQFSWRRFSTASESERKQIASVWLQSERDTYDSAVERIPETTQGLAESLANNPRNEAEWAERRRLMTLEESRQHEQEKVQERYDAASAWLTYAQDVISGEVLLAKLESAGIAIPDEYIQDSPDAVYPIYEQFRDVAGRALTYQGVAWARKELSATRRAVAKDWISILSPVLSAVIAILGLIVAIRKTSAPGLDPTRPISVRLATPVTLTCSPLSASPSLLSTKSAEKVPSTHGARQPK